MTECIVREAVKEDCPGIGKVYCESWKAAYRKILPESYLSGLTTENCTPDHVSADDLVLEEEGTIVGICHVQHARTREDRQWGEIVSIYLLPEKWGFGHGSQLLQKALCKLRQDGFLHICLWVLKENERARAFYEKHGFVCGGQERELEIAGCSVYEVEYLYCKRDGTDGNL